MKAFSLWKGHISSKALGKGAMLLAVESSVDNFAFGPFFFCVFRSCFI